MVQIVVTEADVLALLAKRYAPPVWAFLPQVRNGTGWAKLLRTADALAMALWPSRGLELIGFEIKVTRSDWLRELKDAEKAEEFYALCDRWYVVAPAEAVRKDELPPGWGWIAPGPRGLKVELEAVAKRGKDIDRLFLAAILRRVQEASVPRDSIEAELMKARERGRKVAATEIGYQAEEHALLREKVAAFEKASGVRLDRWDPDWGAIGRAVRQSLEHGPEHIRDQIESHRRWLEQLLKECDDLLAGDPPPRQETRRSASGEAARGPETAQDGRGSETEPMTRPSDESLGHGAARGGD